MSYLIDTNVVSEFRKTGLGRGDPVVAAWQSGTSPFRMFLSVVVLMEIEIGVLMLERRDPAQGAVLRRWMTDYLVPSFSGRIVPIDAAVSVRCAGLHVPDRRPEADALIAATALVHGMTVVTRNIADFVPMGVPVIDPWAA